ncbi:MAG: hypothetical protein ACRCTG_11085 [Aestuariivirga sp.]
MKRCVRLMRTSSLVIMVVGLWAAFLPVLGLAQETGGGAAPSMMETVMAVLKAVLPTALSFVGPLLTKGLAALLEGLSPTVGGIVSTILGSVLGAASAALEGLPPDAYAVVGAGGGLTGHAVLQAKPITAPTP